MARHAKHILPHNTASSPGSNSDARVPTQAVDGSRNGPANQSAWGRGCSQQSMGVQKGQNYEHTHTHTQLSPMLVNTMKAHTCSLIRNAAQKRHSNHAQISRTSYTQVEMSHTQYEPLTHKSKCRTQKSRTFFVGGSANKYVNLLRTKKIAYISALCLRRENRMLRFPAFYLQSTLLAYVFGLNKDTLHRIQQHERG
jgi:hypothetical protein